jgi:membrane protein
VESLADTGYGSNMKLLEVLGNWRSTYHKFVRHELWSPQMYAASKDPLTRSLIVIARTLFLVGAGFSREKLRLRAAALTYMSLLSLVPAMAVVFAVFAGFESLVEARERLKDFVVQSISVTHQDTVSSYLDQFVGQVGALGGVSVVILIFTTVSLLTNIEKSFNDIWGLKQSRNLVQRFQAYWPLLTLEPFLLGVSLALSAKFESSSAYGELVSNLPIIRFFTWLAPIMLTWTGFALMYLVMPNTRVPIRFALLGGVVAGSIHEVAKSLFALYASKALTYSAIYGSFGAIPLLIIGVYVNWLVALTGGLLTFASQNALTYEPSEDASHRLTPNEREHVAVRLLMAIFMRFEQGKGPMPTAHLLAHIAGPPRAKRSILDELKQGGLIVATDESYLPGRAAHQVSLKDVLVVLRSLGPLDLSTEELDPHVSRASELLDESQKLQLDRLANISVAQLIVELNAAEETPATAEAHQLIPM